MVAKIIVMLITLLNLTFTESIGEYYDQEKLTSLFSIPWGDEKGELSLRLKELGPENYVWKVDFPIGVNAEGTRVIVGDKVKNQIYQFDIGGRLLLSIDLSGENKSQIIDLDFNSKGDIVVLRFYREKPAENGMIQTFNRIGRLIKEFKVPIPVDEDSVIFVDDDNNIFVRQRNAPNFPHIAKLDENGRLIGSFKGAYKLMNSVVTLDGKIFTLYNNTLYTVDEMSNLKAVKYSVFLSKEKEEVFRPIGSDREGNLYFASYYRRYPQYGVLHITKLNFLGKVLFSKTIDILPEQYRGRRLALIGSSHWSGAYIDVDRNGNIYFIKPTSQGAEFWKLFN